MKILVRCSRDMNNLIFLNKFFIWKYFQCAVHAVFICVCVLECCHHLLVLRFEIGLPKVEGLKRIRTTRACESLYHHTSQNMDEITHLRIFASAMPQRFKTLWYLYRVVSYNCPNEGSAHTFCESA